MRRGLVLSACVMLISQTVMADTVLLKTGESKKGKVLEETESKVLFDSQETGSVVEIPKISITLIDRDVLDGPSKGSVSFFSESPKSKRSKEDHSSKMRKSLAIMEDGDSQTGLAPKDPLGQAEQFKRLEQIIEKWLAAHPEFMKVLRDVVEKFKSKSDEMDKVVKVAQNS